MSTPEYAKFYTCELCNKKIHEDYFIDDKCDTCSSSYPVPITYTEEIIFLIFAFYMLS
jgi:hypothetical protein